MKWIGQHIWDFISRFRSDVYLENIEDGTVASDKFLGLDSNNKIVKETVSAAVTDLHSAGVDGANGQVLLDAGDGTITSDSTLTYVQGANVFNVNSSGAAEQPFLTLTNEHTGALGPSIWFQKLAVGANDDYLGSIDWKGDDAGGGQQSFAEISAQIANATIGDEAGKLNITVAASDSTTSNSRQALTATGSGTADIVNIGLGYGSGSTTTVAGTLSQVITPNTGFTTHLMSVTPSSDWTTGTNSGNGTHVSFSNSRNTEAGHANTFAAIKGGIGDSATHVGTINYTAGDFSIVMTNTNGTQSIKGISNIISGGDTTNMTGLYQKITDGGVDLKFVSSANIADYFSITTGAEGATTISTVDADTTAADLSIQADGDFKVIIADADDNRDFEVHVTGATNEFFRLGGEVDNESKLTMFEQGGASTADYFRILVQEHGATTLSTVDAAAHAANLTFNVDGFTKFKSPDNDGGGVEIETGTAAGAPALLIDNNDVDQVALDIDATNTTANIIDIDGTSLTTGYANHISLADITDSGGGIKIDWDDTQTTDMSRVSSGGAMIHLDYDKNGDVAAGQTVYSQGIYLSMRDFASNNAGNMYMYGFHFIVDNASTNGYTINYGVKGTVTDGDTNYGLDLICEDDAGADIRLRSSADFGDYCTIATSNHGATKITTVDDDAMAADITLDADGEIILDGADPYIRFYNNGTEMAHFSYHNNNTFLQLKEDGGSGSDYFYIATGEHGATEIATFDGAGSSGNLKFSIDGTISCESTDNLMNLGYDDDASFTLRRTRHSDNDAGDLKIKAGDAVDGQTDKDGGDLYLYGGLQTGSGANGSIFFYGSPGGGGSGTSLAGEKLISKMNVDALMSTTQFWYTSGSTTDYFRVSVGADGATTLATSDGAGTTDANLTVNVDGDIELNADGGTINFKDDTTTLGSLEAGALTINGTGSGPAHIALGENTTNGTNTCRLMAPTSCGNHTLNSPGETGTIQLQGSKAGQTFSVPLKNDDLYILYVSTQNVWYNTGYVGLNFGTSIGSEVDSTACRAASYIATANCKVNNVVIAFYGSGSADLEFQVTKIPLVDNSTSNVTLAAMTHNDINFSMASATNYVKTMTMTGGGSDDNHLSVGQGFTLAIRKTDATSTRILYGNCFAEIELI